MKAILHTDLLAAVALARSTEETRYYLCGVFVEPHPQGGVLMTATDGHVLAQGYDAEGEIDEPRIISLNFKAVSMRTKQSEKAPRRLHISDETGTVKAQIGNYDTKAVDAMICEEIDGTFPQYWRVIPDPTQRNTFDPSFAFAARVMAQISEIAKRAEGDGVRLEMAQARASDPALIRPSRDLLIVAMPMRSDIPAAIPEWSLKDGKPRTLEQEAA